MKPSKKSPEAAARVFRMKAKWNYEIASHAIQKGYFDVAAGRLYYALFQAIRAILEEQGIRVSDVFPESRDTDWRNDTLRAPETLTRASLENHYGTVKMAWDLRVTGDYYPSCVVAKGVHKLRTRGVPILQELGVLEIEGEPGD